METIRAQRPDVFVGLGDMIYADDACNAVGRYGNAQVPGPGPAPDLATFWAHWRQPRRRSASKRLLASTSYVGAWDDHEVVNDFGPLNDTRMAPPYTPGSTCSRSGSRRSSTTPRSQSRRTPKRLYRLPAGAEPGVFVLDTRQYRDANIADDSAERPKTMLGREAHLAEGELGGLGRDVEGDRAERSDVDPDGIPAGGRRDGWGTSTSPGFEQELLDILRFMPTEASRTRSGSRQTSISRRRSAYRPVTANPGLAAYESGPGR